MTGRVDVLGSILGAITEAEADGYTETAEILCATHAAIAELIAAAAKAADQADTILCECCGSDKDARDIAATLRAALAKVQP